MLYLKYFYVRQGRRKVFYAVNVSHLMYNFLPGLGWLPRKAAPQKSVLNLEPRSVLFIDAQGVGTKSGAVNTVVIIACLTPLYAHPTRIHPRASSLSVHS